MKISFLKLKKESTPALKSLRPAIFDISFFWSLTLALFLFVFIATALVGLKLFYSEYFESYKKESTENFENVLDINKLQRTILKRENFIKKDFPVPLDPSI